MIYPIKNLDTGSILYFQAKTPYEAMTKLRYYLALSDKRAEKATINKTESGRFLYLIFNGHYTVSNNLLRGHTNARR